MNGNSFEVIVIGGGQAGLACGWHLQRQGLDFVILDAQESPGGNWRNYYDSLTLFSPARYSGLPGMAFPGDPGRYPLRDEVVEYLEQYSDHFQLPIKQKAQVVLVEREGTGFRVATADGQIFFSKAVVVATGAFSQPYIPEITGLQDFEGRVLHSASYARAQEFFGERVIVVGAANSAVQIAHELAQVAEVTLASREPVRFFPQRLLGIDFHAWLKWTGLEKTRWLNDQSTPVLDRGTYRRALRSGQIRHKNMFHQVTCEGVVWQDGTHEQVQSIIFATGFRPNLGAFGQLPVLDHQSRVAHKNGVSTTVPGLYFVGLPKQRSFASATLRGVGPDAQYIAKRLIAQLR